MNKIKSEHLERAAVVYVRQSSKEQVHQNTESRLLQYALRERAQALGWRCVEVIDEDLGRSGSGTAQRSGFDRLLTRVCANEVGAVFAVDASRFARNGREWHTLLELCGLVDVLIIDQDSIYNPRQADDRLILGMKGTLSEMELGVMRQRMQRAALQKAKRGELYSNVAVGYIRDDDGGLIKDPDRRVQAGLDLVFDKFRKLGSARQVCQWFRQEGVELPCVPQHSRGYGVVWRVPTYNAIAQILTNPVYSGAYVYGRSKSRTVIENGRKRTRVCYRSAPEEWDIVLKEHHAGYVSWEQYLVNRKQLAQNNGSLSGMSGGAARKGTALLTGLLRCGICGKKMSVCYGGKEGRCVRYYCLREAKEGAPTCCAMSGALIDPAVERELLQTLSPLALEAAVQACDRIGAQDAELIRQHELKLEQLRYEAERMRRQYDAIEPENRLVAAELESRWNRALEQVELAKAALTEVESSRIQITEQERLQVLSLAERLPIVWHHPSSDIALKKRIVRTVLKEVVVLHGRTDSPYREKIELLLHWQGGDHTRVVVMRKKRAKNGAVTNEEELEIIAALARHMDDRAIAALLNRGGRRTARGLPWSQSRVMILRQKNSIPPYRPGERAERGELTVDEAAAKVGTYRNKLLRLIARNQLPGKQVCVGAPWIIMQCDVDKFFGLTVDDAIQPQLTIPLCDAGSA